MIEDQVDEIDQEKAARAKISIWDSWRFWAPRAVFEALLIVISLLLALWLSDWQDAQRQARAVAETREALIAEIRANREMLRSADYMPHHERLRLEVEGTLQEEADPARLRQGALSLFRSGIHFPQFRDAAWRTAQTTGVLQDMDREEVFALTDVYGAQTRLDEMVMAYYAPILSMPSHADDPVRLRGALVGVVLFMGDLSSGEMMIVRMQTEALVALDAEAPEPTETEGTA